jgi:hypothetical protein
MKKERDDSRAETLLFLEEKPHALLISSHEMLKADMLENSNNK